MTGNDIFQRIDSLDADAVKRIVARLEARGRDPKFMEWADEYLGAAGIDAAMSVLDIGCGTGVISRRIAQRPSFSGRVVGIDPSEAFVAAGRALAESEEVAHQIDFRVGDGGDLPFEDQSFDRVIAHTTISHVPDPEGLLKEMSRVVAPTGIVALFDGDYASWTFDYPDDAFAKQMEEALLASIIANPRIMRKLRRLTPANGLQVTDNFEWPYVDSPDGAFFGSAIAAYPAMIERAGNATAAEVRKWVGYLESAMQQDEFFAACNYYAVLARRFGG